MKLQIQHFNESFVLLLGEPAIFEEVCERYTYYAKDYRFNPKYKAGIWDGKIRLINSRTHATPKGLVPDIIDYCLAQGYEVEVDPVIVERFKTTIPISEDLVNLPFELYDYQRHAVELVLQKKRRLILSATSSGKSAVIYSLVRSLPGRTLVIVPSSNLVTQLGRKDFSEYSVNMDWDPESEIHLIYDGASRRTNKNIVIATWQSLQHEEDVEWFAGFDNLVVDEVHGAKAVVLKNLVEKCINAFVRVGLTGSLDKSTSNVELLKGLFGPISRVSSTAELMDRGIVSQLSIQCMSLKYSNEIADAIKGLPYTAEVEFVEKSATRMTFLANFIGVLPGNVLVLTARINKHGKQLYEEMVAKFPGKKIYWVNQDVKTDDRDDIKDIMENTPEGVVIIASYKLFSTGISIKNLHHVVFASSTKSLIAVLQSIGRGLRLHHSKAVFKLWDIVDDLRGPRKKANYLFQHFKERLEIYLAEKFDVNITEIKL